MAGNFKASITESMQILKSAEPVIKKLLNIDEGIILDVENQNNDVCKHLDLSCGIDYLVYYKTKDWTRSAAWRAQRVLTGMDVYNTFTIRKERDSGTKTEYEKRKAAIENNAMYPHYTIHAYYDDDSKKLLSLAIGRTKDIIECINKGLTYDKHTGAEQKGQASFWAVKWTTMKQNGYHVETWYNFN